MTSAICFRDVAEISLKDNRTSRWFSHSPVLLQIGLSRESVYNSGNFLSATAGDGRAPPLPMDLALPTSDGKAAG